jgi:arylsulfatase A-like enzyme
VGKQLKAHGYATAWIGKWHVNAGGRSNYIPPERRHGFEHFLALECTHDYNDSKYFANDDPEPRKWPGYDAFAQTDAAIAYMDEKAGENTPFALFLSWGPPHSPYRTAPEAYLERYDPARISLPPNVPEGYEDHARANLAGYYAHCTALNDCMGRLTAFLRERGRLEDTLIVFTSDHGDMIGAHGMYDKQGPWDESLRIPCLVRVPGKAALRGASSRLLHDFVDWFPTLCGLLELEAPTGLQGHDNAGHLLGGTLPEPNQALYACYHRFGNWPKQSAHRPEMYHAREARGLRTERHTYVESLEGPWLFYDNEVDPFQLTNRIADPDTAGTRAELASRLHALLREEGDAFRPGMEYVRRWGYEVDPDTGTIAFDW